MTDTVKIILDLSYEVQVLLAEQDIDLYREIQRQLPTVQIAKEQDPSAVTGSRDIATILVVTTSLVTAITPIVLRLLNQFTPPNRSTSWVIEETETQHPDGSITILRKRVLSSSEQRVYDNKMALPETKKQQESSK